MFAISFKFNDSHKDQKGSFKQNTFYVSFLNGNINDLYEEKSNKAKS